MRRHLWWLIAGILIVGGLALYEFGPTPEFGWFAYTPDGMPGRSIDRFTFDDGPSDPFVFVSRGQLTAAGLVIVGLLVVAGRVGYGLGRRRSPASGSA